MTIKSNTGTTEMDVDLYCATCSRPLTGTFEEPYVEFYSRLMSRIQVNPCAYCKKHPVEAEYRTRHT